MVSDEIVKLRRSSPKVTSPLVPKLVSSCPSAPILMIEAVADGVPPSIVIWVPTKTMLPSASRVASVVRLPVKTRLPPLPKLPSTDPSSVRRTSVVTGRPVSASTCMFTTIMPPVDWGRTIWLLSRISGSSIVTVPLLPKPVSSVPSAL